VELNYPIMISRYALIEDSCGAGRFRGGLGVLREYELPYEAATFTILSDGRKFAPWGLSGGREGRPARFTFDPDASAQDLPSKYTMVIPKGMRVRIETPGGGGFGDPGSRDPAALQRDLRDQKVSSLWIAAANGRGTSSKS
jgi:N-methylhydantoinase B